MQGLSRLATAAVAGALAFHSTSAAAACNGYVGITFDDGPTSNTATLVNLLKQNNLTPVTWFNWGQRVSGNPSLIAQPLSNGLTPTRRTRSSSGFFEIESSTESTPGTTENHNSYTVIIM